MAALRVPPVYRHGLTRLGQLGDEQVEALLNALRLAPERSSSLDLERHLNSADLSIETADLQAIIQALISLYSVGSGRGWDIETIADRLSRSPDIELPDAGRDQFAERVKSALAMDVLLLVAKTIDVMTEHGSLYVGARVLSDLRPVFRDDVADPPLAMVLLHTLRLSHVVDGEVKNLFATMDEEDVENLIQVLSRATEKGQTLRTMVGQPALPIYSPTEGEDD